MVVLQLSALAQKIKSMREKFVEQKLVDETSLPAVIDETSDNVEAINKKLRGSILRVPQPAGLPAGGPPEAVDGPPPTGQAAAAGLNPYSQKLSLPQYPGGHPASSCK